MAHKITIGSRFDSKTAHTVATQAAATLTIGDGELGIFVGTAVVAINNQRCVSALTQLRDALKEANFPDGALADNFAHLDPLIGKTAVVVGNAAAIPALTEDDVAIAYGGTFEAPGNSQTFVGHIDRLIETFREEILKLT